MERTVNRNVVIRKAPEGMPTPSDFAIETEELPALRGEQMLLRTRWLSLDPYMRPGMGVPASVGKTIVGGTVSEVVESRADGWEPGDLVVGYYGWQEYSIATPDDVQWNNADIPIQKWDTSLGPASTAVGVLGMTGFTAYQGLLNVARVQPGETVVVSAASGAVGQVVGQLAKIRGARAVASPGGLRSATSAQTSSASTPASTTRRQGFPSVSRRPFRTASTSTSRTSAATCSRP